MTHMPTIKRMETSAMKPQSTFSPVSLRYIAALRGHKPKKVNADFTYAEAACRSPEQLICLAASNPEGRFYGFVADDNARRHGEEQAAQRGVFNAIFLTGAPSQILARIGNGAALPPMLDYLCCDESVEALPADERAALFDLAQKRLNDGGLFATSYRAYGHDGGALRFLAHEMAPEMDAEQKLEFLLELKKLGAAWLARHPDTDAALKAAIAKGDADAFLSPYAAEPAPSATFDTLVAMGSRGLAYAGDALLTSNYVELAVPTEAQELVVKCRNHMLYEPIKDLALDRMVRSDIWVKAPFDMTGELAELFGGFAYGITVPREDIPPAFAAQGKVIDLSAPLYDRLIGLMTTLPMGIGDFLSHPDGQSEDPAKIVEAINILVACGVASPMRGLRDLRGQHNIGNVAQPRLLGNFNRYLDKTNVGEADIWLASPVMGCGIEVSPRDALVMQALNRAGLANSVSALMPELRRIAETPDAKTLLPEGAPTAEGAQKLIQDTVGKSLPQWYAYGLLEAA
ncbi:MAG: methyltransferase regulatory domain-containing protein [Alphaproteobacteria bacterium]|nr:methyltransferase regulatory domain-containing protein [Alphaproteobacteria bacterium]